MKPATGKFLKIGIFLILTAILAVVFIVLQQSNHLKYTAADVAHTNEVLYNTQKVLSATTDNKIIVRDFILTGDSNYLKSLDIADSSIFNSVRKLKSLTADNPAQQARIDSLQQYISRNIESAGRIISLRQKQGLSAAAASIEKDNENYYTEHTAKSILQIEEAENILLASRKEANQLSGLRLDNMLLWLIIIVLILVVILIQTVRTDFKTLRKAEKDRNDSEEQLRLVLRNVSDYAIFTMDTLGNILSWNEGAAKIKGYTAAEVNGKNISIFYTQEKISSEEHIDNLNKARENGRYETEGWRVKKDGSLFWANNIFTPLYDEKNQLKGYAEISKDITEERKKQAAIHYLSNLVEQTSDAIFSTDTSYIIKSWNKAAEKMYGYTRNESIGKNLGMLLKSRLTGEDRNSAIADIEKNGFYKNETTYTSKKNEYITVLASVTTILDETGEITGYVGVHKDITERKKLEDQLIRFNEELEKKVKLKTAELTSFFERITDAFVAFDKNWCYTYINKKAGELIKHDPSSLIGKNVWEVFPAAVGSATYKLYTTAMETQQYTVNTDYYGPLDLWQENHVYPSPEGISVFIKDITEKKKAEQEINSSNERFQVVATATNDVVWDWDLINQSMWWNKNYYTHFGYPKKENIDVSSWYDGIHPEDRTRVTESINHAIETGAPSWSDEYRFLKADGTPVFVLDRGYIMYNQENKPFRMAGAMVDVTTMRKAEEKIVNNEKRFRALLRNSTDGLILMDASGTMLDISPSGIRILGYSYKDMVGKTLDGFIHAADLEDVKEAFAIIARTPTAVTLLEHRHKMPDGSYKWLECSYNNLLQEPFVNAVVLNYRDITERRNAEEKVRTNEQMLSRAQEIGQFGSWEYDALTRQIAWSDSMYRIHGLNKEQPVSLETFFQQLHPDDIIKVKTVFRNLQEKEERFRDEYRFIKGENDLRYALTTIDAVFEDGKLRKAMGVIQDITDVKKTEEILRQSEARYRKAQAQGKLGHWEFDVINKRLYLSDEIYSIYDLQPDCLADGYETFFNIIHPDDKGLFAQELDASLNGSKTMDIVHRIVRKNGSIQHIHEIAELEKSESGQPLRLTGMAQDVTEQKMADESLRRSEHKYRLLFENNPMPMWMSSIPELNIIDVNESALKQYGYDREEFLRLNSRDLRPSDETDGFLKMVDETEPGSGTTMQWRHKKKDGSIIHVEIFNYKIIYEGKPVWLGLSIDVTEKTIAEALVKKSYEDIRQLASHLQDIREEERANMAREIHDELGQQLTGLKMDISWLSRKKDLNPEQRDQKIKEILSFLDGTVNTVRKLSAELRPSILDDLGLVEALEWWSSEFEKRSGIPCNFKRPDQSIEVSSAIAIGLFRIYQESLTNVARHANATKVFSALESDNNQLILKITDDGKGFDTSNAAQKKTLGLLGMKERTLMMGGSYEIISQPGKGTTVLVAAPFEMQHTQLPT
ncbi:MAG: PAS domain S-box protein [Chitinophagaceae bacterium]